jgi:uncharacterized iron-regulated membrane protein
MLSGKLGKRTKRSEVMWRRWHAVVGFVVLTVIVIAAIGIVPHQARMSEETDTPSCSANYEALQMKMSIAEANAAMGCQGEELSRSEAFGIVTIYLIWRDSSGAIMGTFVNGNLISKGKF